MPEAPPLQTMELSTDDMTLNMGPQHPSTHGVIRFILKTDGEIIKDADPDVGFLHRSIEKIAEKMNYFQFMPYTDRVDYLAAMNCNWGYALVVERLAGIELPPRAEYVRVIVCELNRIASHLLSVGSMGMDIGAYTPFLHGLKEREKINDLLEAACGQRLTYNYLRIGGVGADLPEGWIDQCRSFLDNFQPMVEDFNTLLTHNAIFKARTGGVAPISAADAVAYGLVGPNLRGSGVSWDLRRDEPYSIYPRLQFEVPVGTGEAGVVGDCFDRYMVRVREMIESAKIVRQCLDAVPEGEVMAKIPKLIRPPVGDLYVRTEAPRGELGYYLVSDGSPRVYRLKIRTGSFSAMSIIRRIAPGWMVADLIAIIASLDVVAPEIDR